MSTKHSDDKTVPPLVSSADINEANYLRGRIDDGLAGLIKNFGTERAPNRRSRWRHRVSVASEMTVATALSTKFNRTITPDYVGDDGYDLEYKGQKIEVKTVTSSDDSVLKVPPKQAEIADYVVLTRCTNPSELVQIIGWAPTSHLDAFGYRFTGEDRIRLDANYLIPFEPVYLSPDQIRTSQQI